MSTDREHDRIRILVADDDPRARRALVSLLNTYPQLLVTAEADDGARAVELAGSVLVDAVVLDGIMPGLDGLAAAREIKRRAPHLRILLLSLYGDLEWDALRSGADAFLVKSASGDEIADTIIGLCRPRAAPTPTSGPPSGTTCGAASRALRDVTRHICWRSP